VAEEVNRYAQAVADAEGANINYQNLGITAIMRKSPQAKV